MKQHLELYEDSDDGTGKPWWYTTGHKASDSWSVVGTPDEGYYIEDANGHYFGLDAAEEDYLAMALVIAKLRELNDTA